jgi:hypothetical protein
MSLEPGETDVFNEAISSNYDLIRVKTNCSEIFDEISSSSVSSVI